VIRSRGTERAIPRGAEKPQRLRRSPAGAVALFTTTASMSDAVTVTAPPMSRRAGAPGARLSGSSITVSA
jgi:hypothetical protein